MTDAVQAPKPTPEQRLMAELEGQRNAAMTQSARLGAELMAVRDALDDAVSERDSLKDRLDAIKSRVAEEKGPPSTEKEFAAIFDEHVYRKLKE